MVNKVIELIRNKNIHIDEFEKIFKVLYKNTLHFQKNMVDDCILDKTNIITDGKTYEDGWNECLDIVKEDLPGRK